MEDRYDHFRDALTESTRKVEKTAKQKLMTDPILRKMDQRRLATGNDALYNSLDRGIRQECIETKKNLLTEQCKLIE